MSALAIKGSGFTYWVMDGAVAVAGPCSSLVSAQTKLDALERAKRVKERPCIRCRTVFMSEGAHHRMCGVCRSTTSSDAGDYTCAPRASRRSITN